MTEETAVVSHASTELRLAGPRLPFHPAIEERFGVDRGTWKFLTDVQFPNAEAPESIITALSYCKARRLDIMKKPVNIVSVWDKKRSRMVDSVWPAISESRITAMRTGEYAGKDPTEFGPEITETLGGVEVTYPEWAMVTVYRFIKGQRCAFSGERIRWKEYYAPAKKDTKAPNDMWGRKSYSQASKCAEASALRAAFPEELGASATDVEMEGQSVDGLAAAVNVTPNLMQRLSGSQNGDGFNRDEVIEQTKPTRKPRAKKADAPNEEVQPETDEGAEGHAEEAHEEGHAVEGEVYLLAGDTTDPEGRRLTYKDGVRFSTTKSGQVDGVPLKVYAEHAPELPACEECGMTEGHMADCPAAEEPQALQLPDASLTEGVEPAEDGEGMPDDVLEGAEDEPPAVVVAFRNAVIEAAKASDFTAVKAAMKAFMADPIWPTLDIDQQNNIRASVWDEIVEHFFPGDRPDPFADVSAYRLWVEAQEDVEVLEGGLSKLEDSAEFKGKPDGLKEALRGATAARIKLLSEE